MIDENRKDACRVFLCYSNKTAQTANAFYLALKKCPNKYYGRVWFSDSEPVGNYCLDIPFLLKNAEYVFLFLCDGFTKNFLKTDGSTNYSDKTLSQNDSVTVREIIEIEKQRQQRKNIYIISINIDGERLSENDLNVLEKVFKNEGIYKEDSVSFYKSLNKNAYNSRTEDPDIFIEHFMGIGVSLDECPDSLQMNNGVVDVSALHEPISSHYYGREELFNTVISALKGNLSAICIYGNLGEGKTAFAFNLLNRISKERYHGATHIFYWEFVPSQDKYDIVDGVNQLLLKLIKFFEIDESLINEGEEQQVKCVCEYIVSHKILMILDGFELLLQHNSMKSNISNRTIKYMISTIAREAVHSGSLMLILSGKKLDDLDYYSQNTKNIMISQLSSNDCISIMKDYGVNGKQQSLESAARELDYNPLAVTLFSKHLAKSCNGNIIEKGKNSIHQLIGKESSEETILKNLFELYFSIFSVDSCEWRIITFLSILRRMLPMDVFNQIAEKCDYMESYNILSFNQKNNIIKGIKESGLMCNNKYIGLTSVFKEYLLLWFKEKNPIQFQKCCKILSEYYINVYDASQVNDVLGIEPMYDAIYYLTFAEEYDFAIKLFWEQIYQKRTFFSQKKLGIISNDIFTVSLFFDVQNDWEIDTKINYTDAAWLYSVAAYLMNNIGSLQEAEILRRKEIDMYEKQENTIFVASDGMHLARNLMMQCKFSDAELLFQQIISRLSSGKFTSETNKYCVTLDPKEVLTSVQVRFAFFYFLKGEKYYNQANSIIRNNDSSATGKMYYYIIKCSVSNNIKELRNIKKEIMAFIESAKTNHKSHEIAYAFFVNAFVDYKILISSKRKILGIFMRLIKHINIIKKNIEKSIDYADKAWRMDQYPFILIESADILIELMKIRDDSIINDFILKIFKKLDDVFEFCDIPLYRALYSLVKLKHVAFTNDTEEGKAIYRDLRTNPSVYNFFRDKIDSIYPYKSS